MLNRNLKIFLLVCETKSISKSASKLFISQPAVSQAIKNLEEHLEIQLFYRHKRNGIKLTEIGKKIRSIALEMEHLENSIFQVSALENNLMGGRLRVGSLPILTTTLLPDILKIFKDKYPNVDIELIEKSPKELQHLIKEHRLDIALSCSPFKDLNHITLIKDKMVGILPPGISDKVINLTTDTKNIIMASDGSETSIDEFIGKYKFDFSKTILTQSAESVLALVKRGNGRGVISEYTLDAISPNYPRIKVIPEVNIDIGCEYLDESSLTPITKAFLEIIKEKLLK